MRFNAAFSPNLLKKNAVWIIKRHIALQWHLEDSRTALVRIGDGGIRTHDAAIMRRTLCKHSYYKSVKYLSIFHSSEEDPFNLVQSGWKGGGERKEVHDFYFLAAFAKHQAIGYNLVQSGWKRRRRNGKVVLVSYCLAAFTTHQFIG